MLKMPQPKFASRSPNNPTTRPGFRGGFPIITRLDISACRKYNVMVTYYAETEYNMKSNVKRILPFFFAILVLCSLIWYLFVYDRDFTRDMLLEHARFFENNGKHTVAAWFYQQAYTHADNKEAVAIELAEQYKLSGNYTKAEFTLSNAIADGGSVELYLALCQTYVEQDKLLDAVTMLDNIENAQIRAALEQMRPAAPTVSPAPGFYNQYLTVSLEHAEGTLYTATGRDYPSLEDGAGEGSVQLTGGENTISALVVGENGLVSHIAVFGYTVGGVVEEVKLEDSAIDSAIRQLLGLSPDASLLTSDLWTITEFTVPEEALSLADLAYLSYLESLVVQNCAADSFQFLSSLTRLTNVVIRNCALSGNDLTAISSAPNLQKLTLTGCNLSGISALANATRLEYLDLSDNAIKNLSALTGLSQLQNLNLSHNALTSLNDLSSLSELMTLDVSYNSLVSVFPISACGKLTYLNVSNNLLTDLSGVDKLTELTSLSASYNQLTDISHAAACAKLTDLQISNNELTNISPLASLVKLQYLDFSRNQVSALPGWGPENALIHIDGSYNLLETIGSLAGYPALNKIVMNYNQISSVNALAACSNLIRVEVYGNPVSDVSVLTDAGVTVHYTPK